MLIEALVQGAVKPLRPKPTAETVRGRLQRPVAAVLFDIYGTLLVSASGEISASDDIGLANSQGDSDAALDQWVANLGFTPPAEGVRVALTAAIKKAHKRSRAQGIRFPEVIIEKIWGQLYPQVSAEKLRRLALVYELRVNPVWPMPGLSRCLTALRRNGVRLGIVSNAQFYTPLLMTHFLEGPLEQNGFLEDLCFYSYRLGEAKPGAALYEAAGERLQHYGITPREAVMVGNDRRNDVAAAKAAGFQTVLFAGDERSLRWRREDSDWASTQPDMIITDLLQLSDHLQID